MPDLFPAYHAVFASELKITDLIIPDKNEKISFISPTGLIISNIWFAGTLISSDFKQDKRGTIRIADPTGGLSFSLNPKYGDFYPLPEELIPPLFLSATGFFDKKLNIKNPVQITLESCAIIDRKGRDAWILTAASGICNRIRELHQILLSGNSHGFMPEALTHYHISSEFLCTLGKTAIDALNVIKPDESKVLDPKAIILMILKDYHQTRGLDIDDLIKYAKRSGLNEENTRETLRTLISEDEVYQPAPGKIKLL